MNGFKKSIPLFLCSLSTLLLLYLASSSYTSAATAANKTLGLGSQFDCDAYQTSVKAAPIEYRINCTNFFTPTAQQLPFSTQRPLAPTDIGFVHNLYDPTDNIRQFTLNDFPGQTILSTAVSNEIYGYDYDSTATILYALNNNPPQFGTFDKNIGHFSPIGVATAQPGHAWSGLAIHPIDDTIYAASSSETASALYTIDPLTGQATLIDEVAGVAALVSIAINTEGELYGHDLDTDAIYRIDPTTAVATLIGPTGYNANFAQGMDFDNEDGTLYIFLYQGSGGNIFGTVDLLTGAVTPLAINSPMGEFEGAIQIAAHIPAPIIDLTPTAVKSTQLVNTQTNHTVDIANLGDIDLQWQLATSSFSGQYDNGPLRTSVGDGPGGADVSLLQNNAHSLTLYGTNAFLVDTYYRVSDQFTVSDHTWPLNEITFYTYENGSPITSTITAVNYQIWNGPPNDPASQVVYGDTTSNRLIHTGWTGMYRYAETDTNTSRPIMFVTAAANVTLPPGTYWLDWQLAGSLGAGPWQPPITLLGQPITGDGLVLRDTGWQPVISGSSAPQGLPFSLDWHIQCDDPSLLPWLDVAPTSGTAVPGSSNTLHLTLDSTGLAPATYTASVCISSNDPNSITTTLPITLTVNPIPISYGVALHTDIPALSGMAGTAVTYTVNITNTGNHTDTFNILLAGNNWSTTIPTNTLSLAAAQTAQLPVTVHIPVGVNNGDTDTVAVSAVSQGDINTSDSLSLTTTAVLIPILVDVQLDAPIDALAGLMGTAVTYTINITNTGSHTDTFNINLAGNSWPSTGTPTAVSLVSGQTEQIELIVHIPTSANYGDTDSVTLQATSQADANVSAAVTLTTTAVPIVYGVDVDALDEDLFGPVGTSVTYTLEVINTGSISDTFDITLSSYNWQATLTGHSFALDVAQRATFWLQIDIPATAFDGETDTVTITAVSRSNSSTTDSVQLVTTAVATPPTYAVHLQTAVAQQDGLIGSSVVYALQLHNQGSAADTYHMTLAGNQWPATLSATTVVLNAGEQQTVWVTVQVPAGTAVGATDSVTVAATSQTDPQVTDALLLTTTATDQLSSYTVYLPIIRRP